MSDDLHDALQTVDGIGEAKASDIMDILAEYDTGERDPYIQKAIDAAREGDDRRAAVYLRRAAGGD